MYRGPSSRYGGRSKVAPDTLCQKCLKRGHYSYECTTPAQDRPYKARPSRTQQLLNPKLKPKLMTDVPNELLQKKGVADELLAKKEAERGRKPGQDEERSSRKRSRSVSSYSSDSISTISTNLSQSRSRSASPKRRVQDGMSSSRAIGKRSRRSVSSSESRESNGPDDLKRSIDRNTRRRMSSFSPAPRGRRRSRSRSTRMDTSHNRNSGRNTRSRSHSRGRRRPARQLSRSRSPVRGHGQKRRRSRSATSPMDISTERGPVEDRNGGSRRDTRSRSPRIRRGRMSRSPSRSRKARSPSPYSQRAQRSWSPFRAGNGNHITTDARTYDNRPRQFGDRSSNAGIKSGPPEPPQRERSLSPYSKRVAMTRSMQAGR